MYTVAPFSQPMQRRDDGLPSGCLPCGICRRPVREASARHWAVIVDGGAAWGDASSDADDPGYMGEYPIGSDCHRKFKGA